MIKFNIDSQSPLKCIKMTDINRSEAHMQIIHHKGLNREGIETQDVGKKICLSVSQ